MCAYYRHYYPIEFITAFLNDAANEDDIENGTKYADKVGIKITMPKWGISKSEYAYDKESNTIAKGLSSIKYMGSAVAKELYDISKSRKFECFTDVLSTLVSETSVDTRQLDILIKLDFFSEFGNQRELLRITDLFYNMFKKGEIKQISKEAVEGMPFEDIIKKYSTGMTKTGGVAKRYTILDVESLLKEVESSIKSIKMDDLDEKLKAINFMDIMGYAGYTTGRNEDRSKLYILNVYPLCRKKDGKQFGYSIVTKSLGSGIESRFTVMNKIYNSEPVKKGDFIKCLSWSKDNGFFRMDRYEMLL